MAKSEESKNVSEVMIEREVSVAAERIDQWIPRRGLWLGPVALLAAFIFGNATGFLVRDAMTRREPSSSEAQATAAADPIPAAAPLAPVGASTIAAEQGNAQAAVKPNPKTRRRRRRRVRTPSPAAFVEVKLTSEPTGAWVSVSGVRYGRTPITVLVPPKPVSRFVFEKPGFLTTVKKWSAAKGARDVSAVLKAKK